eukprot:749237-Pelagomonas_calceolata.AAC.2
MKPDELPFSTHSSREASGQSQQNDVGLQLECGGTWQLEASNSNLVAPDSLKLFIMQFECCGTGQRVT